MKLNCTMVEKTSSKTGKPYIAVEIQLTDSYKKVVFLDKAELELVKVSASASTTK